MSNDLTIVVTPPPPLNVEITPPPVLNVQVLTGFGVPVNVGGGGGGGSDLLSYGVAQELTLAQLRTVRRNQMIGSAPTLAYDGAGRVSTLTYADGSTKTLTYDGAGRLSQSEHVYTTPPRTYRKTYAYDGAGRLSTVTEAIL